MCCSSDDVNKSYASFIGKFNILYEECFPNTTVFLSDKGVNVLYDTMNNELYEVCNWFNSNKLSLNASKTNLVLLGTAYKTKNSNVSRSIHLDGCQLTRITNTKFLAMTIYR